jgi:hypothetical protein
LQKTARTIARRFCALEFGKLSLKFLEHREMNVTVPFHEISKQDQGALDALNKCQR